MRRLLALCLALSFAARAASPAQDYLSEVERHLQAYGGPAPVNVASLEREAGRHLLERCGDAPTCPLSVGQRVAKELVESFGDKHTNLKDPPLARRVRAEIQGVSVPRVGLRLIPLGEAGATLGFVRPGSPAARAGLAEGQLVSAIGAGPATAAALAAAEDGGEVRLALPDRAVVLRPAALPARDLPAWRQVQGVNVINIPSFLGEGVASAFFGLLRGLSPSEPLIVDVRANGGGSLSECLLAASAFGGARHELISAGGSERYFAQGGRLYVGNRQIAALTPVQAPPARSVTVLVGGRTASCGEVFAADLQALGARIVGSPTAGVMNSAVELYDLSDGSLLSVTTSRALNDQGRPVSSAVKPDEEVSPTPADLQAGRDPVLMAALGLLGAGQAEH